jgi:hypothetical protein
MEESDKLLISLIHYFQHYQAQVANKRKFRFEREVKHVELLYDLLDQMAALDWSTLFVPNKTKNMSSDAAQEDEEVLSKAAINNASSKKVVRKMTVKSICQDVENYERVKYLYPFPTQSFDVLDELLEKQVKISHINSSLTFHFIFS